MTNKKVKSSMPPWLNWAREIQAIAQTGDYYSLNKFQRERYSRLKEIAAEIIAVHSNLSTQFIINEFNSQLGYATPKVDVRGAVFRDKKILLVREIADHCWTMPGGWADVGETPSQSVEREVLEESGLVVQTINIIGIYNANRSNEIPLTVFHAYKIIFLCEILGGNIAPGAETSEVRFFSNEEIPKELSYKRSEMWHIEAAFKAVGDPCYLPEFD